VIKLPYQFFTKIVHEKGKKKKKWCTRNKETGKVIEYDSVEKRKHGVMMREAIHHGFKPTGNKGTGKIKRS